MIRKINYNEANEKNLNLQGIKKLKLNNLGECLISSSEGYIIELFSI